MLRLTAVAFLVIVVVASPLLGQKRKSPELAALLEVHPVVPLLGHWYGGTSRGDYFPQCLTLAALPSFSDASIYLRNSAQTRRLRQVLWPFGSVGSGGWCPPTGRLSNSTKNSKIKLASSIHVRADLCLWAVGLFDCSTRRGIGGPCSQTHLRSSILSSYWSRSIGAQSLAGLGGQGVCAAIGRRR